MTSTPSASTVERMETRLDIRTPDPYDDRRMHGCCVFEGGRMLAAGVLQLSLLDNLDKGYVFPAVEPDLRGHGLDGAVLAFADRHGFRLANTEIYRMLRLPVADGLLDELADDAARRHEGYVLETYVDELPGRYLPSYCHLLDQLAVDAPTGDVDLEAARVTPDIQRVKLERSRRIGRTTFFAVAVLDGEVVAHSAIVVPPSATEAHQMGTLVRRHHRGHRLGTAVEVENLPALRDARPDITAVHTQNAETNRWMVDINVRLGFEPVGVSPEFVRAV